MYYGGGGHKDTDKFLPFDMSLLYIACLVYHRTIYTNFKSLKLRSDENIGSKGRTA